MKYRGRQLHLDYSLLLVQRPPLNFCPSLHSIVERWSWSRPLRLVAISNWQTARPTGQGAHELRKPKSCSLWNFLFCLVFYLQYAFSHSIESQSKQKLIRKLERIKYGKKLWFIYHVTLWICMFVIMSVCARVRVDESFTHESSLRHAL